jgi:hypothetical protein
MSCRWAARDCFRARLASSHARTGLGSTTGLHPPGIIQGVSGRDLLGAWVRAVARQARGALQGVGVERITFTEVTERAVREALAAPRQVSQPLVQAYLARRALDYLVGFTLSPLLWRKMSGARSAGGAWVGGTPARKP